MIISCTKSYWHSNLVSGFFNQSWISCQDIFGDYGSYFCCKCPKKKRVYILNKHATDIDYRVRFLTILCVIFYGKHENIWLAKIRERVDGRLIFSRPNNLHTSKSTKNIKIFMTIPKFQKNKTKHRFRKVRKLNKVCVLFSQQNEISLVLKNKNWFSVGRGRPQVVMTR